MGKRGGGAKNGKRRNQAGNKSQSARGGGNGRRKNQGGAKRKPSGGARRSSGKNQRYQEDIRAGRIPGRAGQDYPTNSLSGLRKKGFKDVKHAPDDKIPKDYPRNGGGGGRKNGGGGGRKQPGGRRGSGGRRSGSQRKNGGISGGGGGSDCPGSLDDCIAVCPSSLKVYKYCAATCGR